MKKTKLVAVATAGSLLAATITGAPVAVAESSSDSGSSGELSQTSSEAVDFVVGAAVLVTLAIIVQYFSVASYPNHPAHYR